MMSLHQELDAFVGDTLDDAISSLAEENDDRVRVTVFVEWANVLVELEYPSDANSFWTLRTDCGSHSQHRWSAFDATGQEVMQLVVKHCSCVKALIMQPMCRNCQNRDTWRRPCDTPQNVFFVLPISDEVTAAALLEPMILKRIHLSQELMQGYQAFKPRVILGMQAPKPEFRNRMRKLAWQVEQTAIAAHRQLKKMKQEKTKATSLQLQELMPVQLPMPEEKMLQKKMLKEEMPVPLPIPEEKMPVPLPIPEEKMPVQLPILEEKMPVPLPIPEEKMPVQLPVFQQEKKKKKKRKIIEADDDILSSDLLSSVDKEWNSA